MHGGFISVDSVVNIGSTFTIHIPKQPHLVENV
jgi:signal transduction histidine kinase